MQVRVVLDEAVRVTERVSQEANLQGASCTRSDCRDAGSKDLCEAAFAAAEINMFTHLQAAQLH